jgi:hypothetical protein
MSSIVSEETHTEQVAEETATTYIRMTGRNAFGQTLEKFYKGSPTEAERLFLLSPTDKGGPTSWSMEEVTELPDYVYVTCPCGNKFLNQNLITEA